MKKILLIGIVIALVAIGAGIFFLASNLNGLVAGAIETHGSEVTTTRVGVSGVDISIREGRSSIQGLSVASPEGYDIGDAFSLGDITIDLDVDTIRKDPIVIDEVKILAPVVRAEFDEKGQSNLDELRKRVQAYAGSGGSGGDSGGDSGADAPNIRIRRFTFAEGSIEVDASALGIDAKEVKLPSIELTDVGGQSGAQPDAIAKEILGTVTRQAIDAVARSEVDRLIRDQLGESVLDKAKGLLGKIGGN